MTGFFHLEEIDGRHFLITTEGHGYRSLGINHFHMMTSKDYDGGRRTAEIAGKHARHVTEQVDFPRQRMFPVTVAVDCEKQMVTRSPGGRTLTSHIEG